jgi:hypothetical protein
MASTLETSRPGGKFSQSFDIPLAYVRESPEVSQLKPGIIGFKFRKMEKQSREKKKK